MMAAVLPAPVWQQILRRYYLHRLRGYQASGEWERSEPDLQIVRHLIAPGDAVMDIGANFGFYTVYLATRVGKTGSVASFEPVPTTFDILSSNARKLSLEHVSLHNCAVSNTDGTAAMEVPQFESGNDNYYQARLTSAEAAAGPPAGRRVEVSVRSLDALFEGQSKPVSFIKMDVEGHELAAIQGASRLLASWRPALLIEMSGNLDDPGSSGSQLVALLKRQGYQPYWYDGTALRPRQPGDESINYFFLTADQQARVAARVARKA